MLPPKKLSHAELWVAITQEPRTWRPIDVPRYLADGTSIGQLAMWILLPAEQIQCAGAAEAVAKAAVPNVKEGERSQGYETAYDIASSIQVLYRACRSIEDVNKPFFPDADSVGRVFSNAEIAVLMKAYAELESELGPIVSRLSKDEMEAWCEALARGADAVSPFYRLSLAQQRDLLRYSAGELWSLRKTSISPGTPAENAG